MMRNKQCVKRDARAAAPLGAPDRGSAPEPELLEFLDTFDLDSFLNDPTYRMHLNLLLESFTDEEFDRFEYRHAQRFTLN